MAFRDFIESKKYLKVRKKYLETTATFPNKKLDARVNALLMDQVQYGGLPVNPKKENNMNNKERSPRKEKKKPKRKKQKRIN